MADGRPAGREGEAEAQDEERRLCNEAGRRCRQEGGRDDSRREGQVETLTFAAGGGGGGTTTTTMMTSGNIDNNYDDNDRDGDGDRPKCRKKSSLTIKRIEKLNTLRFDWNLRT